MTSVISVCTTEQGSSSGQQMYSLATHSWSSKPNSRLDHTCQLDIDQVVDSNRQTCIACTFGESWQSFEDIEKMIRIGMNILVLDLSLTSRDKCRQVIEIVRHLEELRNYSPCIGIAMDMTAAPIRTGIFEGGPNVEVMLEEGSKIFLTMDEEFKNKCTASRIFVDTTYFPKLIHSVRRADRIYLDDGLICLVVKEISYDDITCIVEDGGTIGGNKRVTLPRERLNQDCVQSNYLKDLAFAADCDVDYVFTSFAENSSMLAMARSRLPASTQLFAKMETRESVTNLASVLSNSDGVIIRRSHLATQFSSEKIFKLQKHIIGHCNVAAKPVFIVEQLLESMRLKPRPTRAESSDVANAVLDGADGLILTVETSSGVYPFESVTVVDHICLEAERAVFHAEIRRELKMCREFNATTVNDIKHVTGISAVEAAASCGATAIFAITTTGLSAKSIATSRPNCIVIGITRDIKVARHCHAIRGVYPFVYTGEKLDDWSEDMDLRINAAIDDAKRSGLVAVNDSVIIVTGTLTGKGSTNTMQVFKVPSKESKLKIVCSSHELSFASGDGTSSSIRKYSKNRKFYGIDDLRVPL